MRSLLYRCNLTSKSKLRSKSKSKSKSSYLNSCSTKTKFKSKYSDSSEAVANAEWKLIRSANAQPKLMFLVMQYHHGTHDYCVISNEGSSFRVLHDDDYDDDLPRNLLPLFIEEKTLLPFSRSTYGVLGCCGSLIWLLFQPIHSKSQYLVWDMETDTCRYRFPCDSPGRREHEHYDLWAYGFGFDPSSGGHYKLLVCSVDRYGEVYAEVLSLRTRSWKAVHYPFIFMRSPKMYPYVHINGFCYWIATGFEDDSVAIMSFDFAKERFRALIPLPKREKVMDTFWPSLVLAEFQGSLAVVCWDSSEDKPFIVEIWAWNVRGRFWSLVSTFDIPAAADHPPCVVCTFFNNDKLFIEDTQGNLLIYDHATRRHENLELPIGTGNMLFFPYVKS